MATTKQDGKARTRAPMYDIFQRGDDENAWTLIATDVAADNRKAAITRVAADRYGTFAAIRSGEFKVLTRTRRVVEEDDWS